MAKLFKIQAYIVDPNSEFYTDDRLEDCLIYCTQNDLNLDHLKITSVDIGEWDDNLPINKFDCPEAEYEKYFKETQLVLDNIAPSPQVMHDKIAAELHQKLIDQLGIEFKKEN